jgi:MFS family permease
MILTLTPYITSSFQAHSLTATMSIASSIISGVIKLPYAKLLNIWGRPQAFGLMICVITLGLIMTAACQNIETYAAALVFYNVGYSTISFTTTIFIADTSSLRNRALWIAISASPWLATVWAYGPASQSVLSGIGFRWGLGIWAIIYPVVCFPLWALFYYYQKKAEKLGLIRKPASNRTFAQSIVHYLKEFDALGMLILATGLSLFLLAFAIYSYQGDTWRSPIIICFLIFGGLLIIAFALWEKYLAPVTFIPWDLIANRTVFFTYTMVASIYCAWYVWDNYFYSFLIVVFRQSVANATYITNIYTVGATFSSLIMGVVIRYNGHLKWQALFFGVPLTVLGVALMIAFRRPDSEIGYIVMCQIFIAFGGGILVIAEQMTIMAVSSQRDIPALMAMENMVSSIGGSIGDAIAAAMWTGIFPVKLMKYLPADVQGDFASIYGDLDVQSSYPDGSAARDGIVHAYADTQRLMLIAATCLYSTAIVSVLLWKDVNVKKINQNTGTVW